MVINQLEIIFQLYFHGRNVKIDSLLLKASTEVVTYEQNCQMA